MAALTLIFATLLLLVVPGRALADSPAEVETVRRCIQANAPRLSSVLTFVLSVKGNAGGENLSRAKAYWRRLPGGEERLLLRYLEPPDLAGSALLVRTEGSSQPEVHLYLPELGAPQKVTSPEQVQSFLGRSDFEAAELEWMLDAAGSAKLALLAAPTEHAGRRVWAVEARDESPGRSGHYPRVVSLVDREWCVPLEVTFFEAGDRPRKVIHVAPADVRREGEIWVPRSVEIEDRELASRTTLRVEAIEVDVPLGPALLTVPALAGKNVATGPPESR